MASTKSPGRGMGTFFKDCEHSQARWSKCPHEYTVRYRSATGRQTEESGFATQEKAVARLVEVYKAKQESGRSQSRAERVRTYGAMQFREYVAEWKSGQRDLAPASLRHLESLLEHHLLPALGSRRMGTFDHKVVDGFIQSMERRGVGIATQANAYDKLRAVLLDAHRLGLYAENPTEGVKPPQYDPKRAVIPSVEQLKAIRTAGDDVFTLIVDLMSGCGMRNAEAAAVNLHNIVADDVYRITEQVNQSSGEYTRLKHRKDGDYRDVPLPAHVRRSIERYAETHGTVDGYLLRHPGDLRRPYPYYYLSNQWQRIKRSGRTEIPEGMVLYGFRHFFASNCLGHGIPITDVAEWMGHRSVDITFKTYRHLMPGSINRAARVLGLDPAF
ncbi:tyrosine-type recombinase/integrase [Streptacidiphilus sp. ASG 303]|uniref:tyrosine-type recombinase/integrase n=1 Tax=Streptacidiphilus sp. ASG 303 TaxID=2896847 RepID=UPI001E32AD43|nr:tyrosine-type recombinase/integrase [Streptacidiphilus sp. ASG 303]MCD0486429.1 tyrosine-type recombinase/integrase [Streptacidiphilus sp. ASG 303]